MASYPSKRERQVTTTRSERPIPWVIVLVALCALAGACSGTGGGGSTGGDGSTGSTGGDGADGGAGTPSPSAAAVQEITFAGDGIELSGDLYLPEGSGPHPGVVLIHGSGPIDRNATIRGQLRTSFPEPVTVFADLAAALRDVGYAVLTYDKRTCGPFNDCADNGYPPPPADLTVDAFVSDATAAVAHLQALDDVDDDALAVIGHSQGASFVPAMLIDDPGLTAGVMLAAQHDPIDEILLEQDEQLGKPVTALRSEDVEDGTIIQGASAAFWRSWMRITDGVPQLATQVTQPLLLVGGELDANVSPAQLDAWRQTLGDDAQIVELECVSHALNCLDTDDMTTIVPADVGRTVAPSVTGTVIDFLDAAL